MSSIKLMDLERQMKEVSMLENNSTKLLRWFSSLRLYASPVELVTERRENRLKSTKKIKGCMERHSALSL